TVCHPNFEFEGIHIANSGTITGEGSFNKSLEVRFEQTGSANPQSVAKSLNGTNLVVAVRDNGNLFLVDKLDTNNAFLIDCKAFCKGAGQVPPGDLSADGYTIKSAFDNKRIQVGKGPNAGAQGDRIFVTSCDGTDSQRFNFITSPLKKSGAGKRDVESRGIMA
ncbi:hypothetical protein V5O48_016314, partial [Marasmius crinis-equi]